MRGLYTIPGLLGGRLQNQAAAVSQVPGSSCPWGGKLEQRKASVAWDSSGGCCLHNHLGQSPRKLALELSGVQGYGMCVCCVCALCVVYAQYGMYMQYNVCVQLSV